MSQNISIKYNNYDYAPGIATYGIDGKAGRSGQNGTSVFVCQEDITTAEGLQRFGQNIRQNVNMSSNDNSVISRPYINGDCFLFPNCDIYKITDIDGLKTASIQNQLGAEGSYTDRYMEKVGAVNISQTTTGFSSSQNRLVLDTANYDGFIINSAGMSDDDLSGINSPFTIISNDVDSDGQIHFINIKSIYSGIDNSEMNIYYDSDNDAYHIDSNKSIVINADLKVSENQSEDFDEFSSVLIKDNGITNWHGICDNITWYTNITGNNIDFMFINDNNESFANATLHIVGILNNEVKIERYVQLSEDIILSEDNPITVTSDVEHPEDIVWKLSIIGPVEVYLTNY